MTRAHLISFLSLAFVLPFLTGCGSKPAITRTAVPANAVKSIEGKRSEDDSLVKTAKISGEAKTETTVRESENPIVFTHAANDPKSNAGEYSSEYDTCVQKADAEEPGSNGYIIATKDCAYKEDQRWDTRLNAAYKAIMAEPTYVRRESQKRLFAMQNGHGSRTGIQSARPKMTAWQHDWNRGHASST
jgi:hypothetical protein